MRTFTWNTISQALNALRIDCHTYWNKGTTYLRGRLRRPQTNETEPIGIPPAPVVSAGAQSSDPLPETRWSPMLDVPANVRELKAIACGLTRLCKEAEPDFLGLGGNLQTLHEHARELTRRVLAALATDQDQNMQGALQTIQARAGDALQELKSRSAHLSKDLVQVTAIRDALQGLLNQNGSFKQVAKNLKMVGLNISIESARNEASKATFQALADEINQLAQTVQAVAANIADDTGQAQQLLNRSQTDISARTRHLDELLAAAETAVNHALQEIEALTQMNLKALDAIATQADEIGAHVSRLVVSIQIHDNISQRVAHVNESIAEAVELFETSAGLDLPEQAQKVVLGKNYGISRLQVTQIQTIIDDVAEVQEQCEQALAALQSAVTAIAQPEGLDLAADDSPAGRAGARHPVVVLEHALEQLISLFDEGIDDIQRLTAAREQTGKTIARMGQHVDKVRDINFEIRLKALNAVIKSSRLGNTGKAIEAIVIEMKALAEQSNATIQSVTDIMERITSSADHLDQRNLSGTEHSYAAGQLLRTGIDIFTQARTALKEQSLDALKHGALIEEKITQARQQIGFFKHLLAACADHLAAMKQINARLEPFAQSGLQEWQQEERSIVARYTMQREREVHAKALHAADQARQAPVVPAAAPDGNSAANPAEEQFADNVELF